ncbi:Uncharacterized protein TCM_038395 [Theobroma cacao]|uniref:Uncharacterized protein n=1 Tax=Theobroma cacao TaxID=3641 RepID=A0A061GQL9_THECC|nr:Uncharacterized protein TCM_038395 [Theobroma cacao]
MFSTDQEGERGFRRKCKCGKGLDKSCENLRPFNTPSLSSLHSFQLLDLHRVNQLLLPTT